MTHLHPIVVHFPITWLITAVGFDIACLRWRHLFWLDRVSLILHGLAVLGAGVAVTTGKIAQASLGSLPDLEQMMVQQHSEWAFFALLATVVVFLLRIETVWRDRENEAMGLHKMRVLSIVVAFITLVLLFITAHRGASLVYDLGIAVGMSSVR
jgi:uncharacterized membrane protein